MKWHLLNKLFVWRLSPIRSLCIASLFAGLLGACQLRASLSVEHEVFGQYYAAEKGSGWVNFFEFVADTRSIRIPIVDDTYGLTGRYRIFRYDGTYFSYIGEGACRSSQGT